MKDGAHFRRAALITSQKWLARQTISAHSEKLLTPPRQNSTQNNIKFIQVLRILKQAPRVPPVASKTRLRMNMSRELRKKVKYLRSTFYWDFSGELSF